MSESPIQIFSNDPEGVVVTVGGHVHKVTNPGDLLPLKPTLFLLTPLVRATAAPESAMVEWVVNVRHLLDVFASHQGPKLMLQSTLAEIQSLQLAKLISETLQLTAGLKTAAVEHVDFSASWSLLFDAALRANTSHRMILEEAQASCFPFPDQSLQQRKWLARVAADSASELLESDAALRDTRSLLDIARTQLLNFQKQLNDVHEQVRAGGSVKVPQSGNDERTADLKQRNELLQQQLEQLQKDLEGNFLKFSPDQRSDEQGATAALVRMLKPAAREFVNDNLQVMFDRDFYANQAGGHALPVMHYRFRGWKQGHSPHPLFDAEYYAQQLQLTPAELGTAPLLHYLRYGIRVDLSPHPDFDSSWYRSNNPDVVEAGVPSIIHYVTFGAGEGRAPSADFDGAWYLAQHPDVDATGMNPLIHYVVHGRQEGRAAKAVVG